MFWKFHLDSSGLDTLLAKQDVRLKEVLDEEDVLQECKSQNGKLIDFLTRDEITKELLHLVVDTPPDDVEEAVKYKYPNLACELITLDIYKILDKIANDTEYLDIIWSYVDTPPPLNPLIGSFFSKVIAILICRKGQETFAYLKSHDAVNKLIVHIEISAIMELFIKMVTVVESQEIRIEISRWLDEEQLINKLIKLLHPSEKEEKHYNSSQLLSELVRIGRDSISQYTESEDDPLLLTLEKKYTMKELLSTMFELSGQLNSDSSVVHGISTISSMLEIRRLPIEGMEELITPMDVERIAQGMQSTLEVLAERIPDFHDMLIRPHANTPMETTFGILDPPLGKVRLNITSLITTAVCSNTEIINSALAKAGTIGVLMDLFSRYEWNNFLHSYVLQCISAILCSESSHNNDALLLYLFNECNIIQKCVTLWEGNEITEKAGDQRKGFMGHLTKIINEIVKAKERGPNNETIQSMFNALSEDTREQWNELITGSLEETNKKNLCSPVNSSCHAFDSDSDNDDYRPITDISQYEGTLQQAFENYQVQPMTNEFIETFGYDEDSVQQSNHEKSPFDEVGNIDFSINANEESENEKLFESICEQKIRPFDDSDDSDEEDIWEEKQLTFTSASDAPRSSKNAISSESDSSSDDEKCTKDDESNNGTPTSSKDDKMEVDSEWTANFDNVGMEVQPDTSNWASAVMSSTPVPPSPSGENFAGFTVITAFEISDSTSVNSPDAMDMEAVPKTNPSSVYEVNMEEDNQSQIKEISESVDKDDIHTDETTSDDIHKDDIHTDETTSDESDQSFKLQKTDVEVTAPLDSSNSVAISSGHQEKMVGGYVVIDAQQKNGEHEVARTEDSPRATSLTTITVNSIRSPTKQEVNNTTLHHTHTIEDTNDRKTFENCNQDDNTVPQHSVQDDENQPVTNDIETSEKAETIKRNDIVDGTCTSASIVTNGPISTENDNHEDPMT